MGGVVEIKTKCANPVSNWKCKPMHPEEQMAYLEGQRLGGNSLLQGHREKELDVSSEMLLLKQ